MAGVPEEVLERARKVLNNPEEGSTIEVLRLDLFNLFFLPTSEAELKQRKPGN